MPNICENVIEIQGALKNVEKLLDTCKTVGHEGRFDNNESIEVYDLTLGREMPSEFHTIATGGNTINGVKVDKWEYVHKETGEAFPNGLEAMQNEDLEAVAVSEERLEELKEKFGFDNWYDWAYSNWGTKWVTSVAIDNITMQTWTEEEVEMAQISFVIDSAWAPPYVLLEFLANEYDLDIHDRWWEEGGEAGWIHIVDQVVEEE